MEPMLARTCDCVAFNCLNGMIFSPPQMVDFRIGLNLNGYIINIFKVFIFIRVNCHSADCVHSARLFPFANVVKIV